jgi:oxaloacetate decarboxylase (Na+ extruding) subunit alpha
MNEIRFVDTTLRDGHQSLWAESMRTGMMLPVAADIDRAGFDAVELVAPSFFKKCCREFREDAFERIRLVRARMPNTPLRAIRNRYMAGFQLSPESIGLLWLERLAANGIRELRSSDPSNTVTRWAEMARTGNELGLKTIINLTFSVSPKHTDEYYAERARAAAKLPIARLCIKDPGALFTPERTRTLVPAVMNVAGNIPVEFHTHCITGLGPLCCLEAIKLGIRSVNTAIPPLANGSSNPSLFAVARNARALGYRTRIDEEVLRPVENHFNAIAKREGFTVGAPREFDSSHAVHQVPGGMISNFRFQLSKLGMVHRLTEVLEEVGRVREELGYPIMVTPYSQFVGVQAAMNVILGERYKEVTDEIIQYAIGFWGEEECASIDPTIKDKILNRPRARELAKWEPPQTTLKEFRAKLGGPWVSDEELMLRYFAGKDDVAAMKTAGPPKEYITVRQPLVALIKELSQRRRYSRIYIEKGDFSLRIEQRAQPNSGAPT